MPQKVQIAVTLNINPAPPPKLSAGSTQVTLPDETVGEPVSAVTITSLSGGTPPFSLSIDPASPSPLPPGLSLAVDANGQITLSGTPTMQGAGTFVVDAVDSGA